MRQILIILVKTYQFCLSPFFGQGCRFYPTCSQYMINAINEWGAIKGIFLGIKRLARCNPLCNGGVDEVPSNEHSKKQ